jgi:hypothetical protein
MKMAASIKDPIFLVGCPRSGTTLLQQMLDAHPDVAIAPETFFIRNFWLQKEQYGDLEQDHNYHQLLEAIIALPEFSEMELNPESYREAALQQPRDYPSLFRLLLSQFAHQRGVTVVGEKTPNHLLYVPTLQQFFPSARFIHIVRDPRAVVRSWQTVPWTTGTLAGDAKVWQRYMATARQYPALVQSSLFTLHYEELITAPEKSLTALCHFLQLTFTPAMMTYYQQPSLTVNTEREPWKLNAQKQLSQASLDRWRSELDSSGIAAIEAVAGSEMKYLGYAPITQPVKLFTTTISAIVQDKLRKAMNRVRSQSLWQPR